MSARKKKKSRPDEAAEKLATEVREECAKLVESCIKLGVPIERVPDIIRERGWFLDNGFDCNVDFILKLRSFYEEGYNSACKTTEL